MKNTIHLIFTRIVPGFGLLASVTSGVHASYLLTHQIRDQVAELRVNGFPYELSGDETVTTTTRAILPFLIAGENVILTRFNDVRPLEPETVPFFRVRLEKELEDDLELVVQADRQVNSLEGPETLEITHPETFLTELPGRMSLRQTVELADGQQSRLVVDKSSGEARMTTVTSTPPEIVVRVDLPDVLLTVLPWQQPGAPLDDAGKTKIRSVAAALRTALDNRDIEALNSIYATKNTRRATAFGLELAQIEANQADFFTELFAMPGFTPLPLDTSLLAFSEVEGVNLVKVTGPDGTAAIVVDLTDYTYEINLFFSNLEGEWTLVE